MRKKTPIRGFYKSLRLCLFRKNNYTCTNISSSSSIDVDYGCGVVPIDDGVVVVVVVPLAGILVELGATGDVVLLGDGDAVVCGLIAFGVVVDGDVVDGDVVLGIVVERVLLFCLVVVAGAGTVLGLPLLNAPLFVPLFNVPLFTPSLSVPLVVPLFRVPLLFVPLLIVPLVVPGVVVVGVVVPGTLAGFVCADATPKASTAATVKIIFFILLYFFVVYKYKIRHVCSPNKLISH